MRLSHLISNSPLSNSLQSILRPIVPIFVIGHWLDLKMHTVKGLRNHCFSGLIRRSPPYLQACNRWSIIAQRCCFLELVIIVWLVILDQKSNSLVASVFRLQIFQNILQKDNSHLLDLTVFRGRRLKDYGVRLVEKQKLRYHYNVLEKQFRRYIAQASRLRGNTGEVLLQLLEQRLDNVLRRAGLVRTIWAARQMVVHGHVLVNGKKVDRPSFCCFSWRCHQH